MNLVKLANLMAAVDRRNMVEDFRLLAYMVTGSERFADTSSAVTILHWAEENMDAIANVRS